MGDKISSINVDDHNKNVDNHSKKRKYNCRQLITNTLYEELTWNYGRLILMIW